jgi:CRISPR-associated protein Cas2
MKYVIAFDISDDKVRYRAVKVLLEHCYRVQKSVFEGFLSRSALAECMSRLEKLIDPQSDSIRCYQLCSGCADNSAFAGNGPRVEQVQYIII